MQESADSGGSVEAHAAGARRLAEMVSEDELRAQFEWVVEQRRLNALREDWALVERNDAAIAEYERAARG